MKGALAMGGTLTAADAAACASRSFEVQQLAARVASCAEEADAVLARLGGLELQTWQSPAGRAYRTTISLQAASLRRARGRLHDAAAAVLRHAQNVTLSSGRPGY
ncbi:hypothetical protein [Arthrobacter sp. UYEF3]|uniref:hypothetical protein n=1 Tax=Arthrobacter sp. UYEF3 TaxID=1756365 RepID=UPI003398E5B3